MYEVVCNPPIILVNWQAVTRTNSTERNSCWDSLHFVESGSSLPCSQELSTCSYPETVSPAHLPAYFLKVHFNTTSPSMPRFSKWCLSFGFLQQGSVLASSVLHICYMPHQSHCSWFCALTLTSKWKAFYCITSICSILSSARVDVKWYVESKVLYGSMDAVPTSIVKQAAEMRSLDAPCQQITDRTPEHCGAD